MSPKRLALLAAAFAVLLAALAGLKHWAGRPPKAQRLWDGEGETLVKLSFEKSGAQAVVVERKGKAWEMLQPYAFPADAAALDDLAVRLPRVELSAYLSENPAKAALFEVDASSGLKVKAWAKEAAPVIDAVVGKSASAFDSFYLRREGGDRVVEASGLARYFLDKPAKDWLDKTVVSLRSDDIERMEVLNSSGTLVFQREGSGWRLASPASSASTGTVKARLEPALVALVRLEADELLPAKDAPARMGWDRPSLRLRLKLKDGGSVELTAGVKDAQSRLFVKKSGEDRMVYLLSPFRFDAFRKSASDFR